MLQKFRFLPLATFFTFFKTSAFACAVCFGATGGKWSQGFTWGVAFLIVLPFLMMLGFIGWIALAIRKKATHQ